MGFPRSLLSDDEEIALELVPHWWFMVKASAILAGAIIVGLIAVVGEWPMPLPPIIGFGVLIALGYFAIRYGQWRTTNFVVTNERVISRAGVLSKKGIEIPLDRINTVFFQQGAFERMIGAGSLKVESAGEGGQQTFTDIRSPNRVQSEIYEQMEAFEARRLGRMGEALATASGTAPAAPTGDSIPDQIARLDELRQQGAITDDEYQTKKRELLDRM